MAVSAIIIGTAGLGTVTASSLFVAGSFALFSTAGLTYFLTTAAIGLALNALSPKPKIPRIGSASGYTVNTRGAALDHQIIYGEARVGGAVLFDSVSGTNNKYLHRAIGYAGHEIDSYQDIYIDDGLVTSISTEVRYEYEVQTRDFSDINRTEFVTIPEFLATSYNVPIGGADAIALGLDTFGIEYIYIRARTEVPIGDVLEVTYPDGTTTDRFSGNLLISQHLGATDQLADSDMVANIGVWTSAHRLQGIAYLYCRFGFDADAFPNGVPVITAKIRGKKVYDPRTTTTVWSNNPALCLRDYLTTAGYGLGEEAANIDDTTVITAANVCDFSDYPTLTGDVKYTCNGSFTTAVAPYDMLGDLLTSMGGLVWYAQGKWRMKPAYWTAPVLSLDEDDLRSSVNLSTRRSRRDNFNTVKGIFRGEETNWQPTDYPEVTNAAFVTADGGQVSVADIDLPYTTDSVTARQIALIALERNRQQLTVSASFGMRAFQVQVGDNVSLTNTRFGWTDKAFEVTSWTFGLSEGLDLQVQMTLREISESVFDEVNDGIVYERDNTALLSAFEVPSVGISAVGTTQVIREKLTNIINVTITSGRPEGIDHIEVEFRVSGESDYTNVGTGDLGLFRVVDVDIGFYDFRARAVNTFGVKGEWEYIYSIEVAGSSTTPDSVTGFTAELNGSSIHLEWEPISNPDLSYYRIRHSLEEVDATYNNATTAVDKVPRPANSVSVPARSGTYHIKAIDKSGTPSEDYTSIVVPAAAMESFTTTITQTQAPDFFGVKTDSSVVSNTLRITDPSVAPSSATYDFGELEIIRNYGFDSNVDEWGIANGVKTWVNGEMEVDFSSASNYARQTIDVVAGESYTFTWEARLGTKPELRYSIYDLTNTTEITNSVYAATTSMQTFSVPFVAPAGCTEVHMYIQRDGTGTGTCYFDNVSVKRNTGDVIDTGSPRLVRARVDVAVVRHDNSAGLWDDLTGEFDSLSGLFDNLTSAPQSTDQNIKTYISITQDDPEISPTWTAYQAFRVGDYYGRAFRFRASLLSEANNITPSVTQLDAIVEYN